MPEQDNNITTSITKLHAAFEKDKNTVKRLEKLSIKNFMGFRDTEQTIQFGIPNEEKIGSGLTVIVGLNNSGKTSILQAIQLMGGDKPSHDEIDFHVLSTNEGVELIFSIAGRHPHSITADSLLKDSLPVLMKLSMIESSRFFHSDGTIEDDKCGKIGAAEMELPEFLDITATQNLRTHYEEQVADSFNAALIRISNNNKQKLALLDRIKSVYPSADLSGYLWHTKQRALHKRPIPVLQLVKQFHALHHDLDLSGKGVLSIIRICMHLLDDDLSRILVIDEPELSLHPEAQRALANLLAEESKRRQIILVTHSTYFANWLSFLNGAKVIRTNLDSKGSCVISQLDSKSAYAEFITTSCTEHQKPYLFDEVAKEILFSNKTLLLEGIEDKCIIEYWLQKECPSYANGYLPPFGIFGYGVGGVNNIGKVIEITKALNLSKVGILLDMEAHDRKCSGCGGKLSRVRDFAKLISADLTDEYVLCNSHSESQVIDQLPSKDEYEKAVNKMYKEYGINKNDDRIKLLLLPTEDIRDKPQQPFVCKACKKIFLMKISGTFENLSKQSFSIKQIYKLEMEKIFKEFYDFFIGEK